MLGAQVLGGQGTAACSLGRRTRATRVLGPEGVWNWQGWRPSGEGLVMPGGGGPRGENLKGYVWREEGWGEEEGGWMGGEWGRGVVHPWWRKRRMRGVGGGKGDGEVVVVVGSLKGLSFPQVPEWGECTWTVVAGALRQPPREEGGECILGLAVLPGYDPVFLPLPRPPHLEALALETSEPRQQLQKLGTSSPLSWRVGRAHKREGLGRGYLILSPPPAEARGQGRAPPAGESIQGE